MFDFTGWLRHGDATRRAGISAEYLRDLVAAGRIETVRTPAGLIYRAADCDAIAVAREERARARESLKRKGQADG